MLDRAHKDVKQEIEYRPQEIDAWPDFYFIQVLRGFTFVVSTCLS